MGDLLPHRARQAEACAMKSLLDCYLYGIVDLGYVNAADAPAIARRMLEGGVDILQLRAKGKLAPEIVSLAQRVEPICRDFGTPLIINDHPWLVARCAAAGCHIGQDDGPITSARMKAGTAAWVGRSTHSLEQARAARDEGADYLGFGPIFSTPTKPDYPAIGLQDIAQAHRDVSDRPIFCIGGIKLDNLERVLAAGAKRVVIVSGLLQAPDAGAYARACRALLGTKSTVDSRRSTA
jgi:thiamine-phosphate pyrophosphorylase